MTQLKASISAFDFCSLLTLLIKVLDVSLLFSKMTHPFLGFIEQTNMTFSSKKHICCERELYLWCTPLLDSSVL